MGISVGLGLTNNCNLSCPHCYRPTEDIGNLTVQDIRTVCDSLDVGSTNLGTGENILNPEFFPIVQYLQDRRIKTSLTSNGYSVSQVPDEMLKRFHDVEFSFDFGTREGQDAFRGSGAWKMAIDSMERCLTLGVEVTILACLMRINYDRMGEIAKLAGSYGVNFRVNVYQPVRTDRFSLTYENFWDGFRQLFDAAPIVTCTEPIVNVALGWRRLSGPQCGRSSIRVTPYKKVLPCVYWPTPALSLKEVPEVRDRIWETPEFQKTRAIPEVCRSCEWVQNCWGGCASRRILRGDLYRPDEFCPIVRGEQLTLNHQVTEEKELLHAANVCTTIVNPS
ncbi:MAG: radical SAM protein [Deltaproteobacteria bacterium]|nr:radical SAM protein [Deltaproteobacteria bacterium]